MSIWDRVTDVKRLRAEIKRLEREYHRLKNKQNEEPAEGDEPAKP